MPIIWHINRLRQLIISHQRAAGEFLFESVFLVRLIAGRHRQPGCRRIVYLQNVLIPVLRVIFIRRAQISRFILTVMHRFQAFVRSVETGFKTVSDSISSLSVQIHIECLILYGSGKMFKFNRKLVDQNQAFFFPAFTGDYIHPICYRQILTLDLNFFFASVGRPPTDGNLYNLSG